MVHYLLAVAATAATAVAIPPAAPTVSIAKDVDLPMVALGTGSGQKGAVANATALWLGPDCNGVAIDTSIVYKDETEIKEGLARVGVARGDVFLETKLVTRSDGYEGDASVAAEVADNLDQLGVSCFRRAGIPRTGRGDAAAATWKFRGDESRRRRGCDADILRRRVAATPWLRRGNSAETRRGDAVDIRWRRDAATPWTFRGDETRRRRGRDVDIRRRRVAAAPAATWTSDLGGTRGDVDIRSLDRRTPQVRRPDAHPLPRHGGREPRRVGRARGRARREPDALHRRLELLAGPARRAEKDRDDLAAGRQPARALRVARPPRGRRGGGRSRRRRGRKGAVRTDREDPRGVSQPRPQADDTGGRSRRRRGRVSPVRTSRDGASQPRRRSRYHDDAALEYNKNEGIVVQAYSPLCGGFNGSSCTAHGGKNVLTVPEVIATASKYDVSAARVGLKWIVQQGFPLATATWDLDYMNEDLDLWSFTLADDDMALLSSVYTP